MKKVLVTGSSGYIGSKLIKHLYRKFELAIIIRKGSNIDSIKDISSGISIFRTDLDFNSINTVIESFLPDVTIHLASLFINEHKSDQIKNLIESNILFGTYLLEALTLNKCLKFINTGTSWQHYNNESYNPANLYAATKQAFDDLIRYYVEAKNLKAITLKIFDTYGTDDPRPKIFALLKRIAETGEEIQMSAGEQEIEFVHINDVLNAYQICLERLINNKVISLEEYGIACGNPKTLRNWVEDYQQYLNKPLNIVWGGRPYRLREVMTSWKNFRKIDNLTVTKNIFNLK